MCPYQWKLVLLIDFLRQNGAFFGICFPLEYFSERTRRPTWGAIIRFFDFLRHSLTILVESVAVENDLTDKLTHLFNYFFKFVQSASKMTESD